MYVLGDATSVIISVQDYPPGDYNLTIIATDTLNQTVDERVPLFLAGMPSHCFGITPIFYCEGAIVRRFTKSYLRTYAHVLTHIHTHTHEEPLLFGECRTDSISNRLSVACNTSLDGFQVPLTYSCSYDGGPQEPCI